MLEITNNDRGDELSGRQKNSFFGDRSCGTLIFQGRLELYINQLSRFNTQIQDILSLKINYDRLLYQKQQVLNSIEKLETLVKSVVRSPEQLISELETNSNSDPENESPVCIHQLFEIQAKKNEHAIAIVFEENKLTYLQLNERANQLAHHLQKLGVKPDTLVGICMERSLEVIVAILGILKAGAAYVPIDPKYPEERLAYMLEDSGASILLTQQKLQNNFNNLQANVICLDTDWAKLESESKDNPKSEVQPHNLVYVIYTSGSTGLPKGVAIEHQQLFNYVKGISEVLNLPEGANYATVSTFAADLGNTVIFPSLCNGGCLHVISADRVTNPKALAEYFQHHAIDCLKIVPSHLRALLTSQTSKQIIPRQRLVLGGEASSWDLVAHIQSIAPNCQIINHYGPTETTVGVLTYKIEDLSIARQEANTLPIGRPLPNIQTYILDEQKQKVPDGAWGELYIGGAGLARGYLNRPELTAEKFISNPIPPQSHDSRYNGTAGELFGGDLLSSRLGNPRNALPPRISGGRGDRLYKTGDLVRYLSDGSIEFSGRIDNQVKIRGFRIELGEIETALLEHAQINSAVVMAREDKGDRRLVAYLVGDCTPTVNELRQFLKQKLPDQMIPSSFVFLEALPLTPNGKLDRHALPAPEQIEQPVDDSYIAPKNEIELKLTKVWEKVLGIKQIGVKDDFFELGGDSLLAVRLFAEIEKTFQQTLPMVSLLQASTLEQLANVLDRSAESTMWRSLVPLQVNGSKRPLFLIHARGASILLYRNLTKYINSEQPVYALQPKGLDPKQEPLTRVEDMAAHYLEEIRTIQPQGPYQLGGYSLGGKIALEMAQQLRQQGERVDRLIFFDCRGENCFKRLPLKQRIKIHVENLWTKKHHYIIERAIDWQRWLKDKFKFSLQKKAIRIFKKLGLSLPLTLRNAAIEELNFRASRIYQPKFYKGKILLLRAIEWLGGVGCEIDEQLGWGDLAGEGVKIYDVPGNHFTIFDEPHVRQLAKVLETCIAEPSGD
ncbi:MAG: non-ribosomal peptide synthetase [Xenococcaceae cyanobacterium]